MNPSTRRYRMCRRKKRYATAKKAIHAALVSSKAFGKPMRWYTCEYCGAIHLTSQVES